MNIYDEAIKNVKSLDYLAEWYESDVVSVGYEEAKKNRETMAQNIKNALERAKKVEELLELYREKDKLRDELFNEYTSIYSTAQSLNKIVNDFKQIQEQINILEKELEEMK